MQNFQLKTEEYQLLPSTDNVFHLRPLPSQSSGQLDLQYNFAPLICSKTEKIIRTLPSISQQKSNSTLFYTQIDVQFNLKTASFTHKENLNNFRSMKNFAQTEKTIYVSKPSSHYCQICKDTFSDYLQHINHSSHQKKLKEGSVTEKDFLEIQSILKNKNLLLQKQQLQAIQSKKVCLPSNTEEEMRKMEPESKGKTKIDSRGAEFRIGEANPSYAKKWPLIAEVEEDFFSSMNFGSKKRIVENQCGEKDFVLLTSAKMMGDCEEEEREKDLEKFFSLKTIDSNGNKAH